jgi:prepilin-type N-terminal cleavage/methylation domain-containing protein
MNGRDMLTRIEPTTGGAMDTDNTLAVRKRMHGFTLVELMVVVAIVAILAGVALPSYQDSVRKSRRGQAKADLVELAQGLERFRSVNNTYAGYVPPFAISPRAGGTAQYNLNVTGVGATAFLITAAPIGAQTDDTCGALTVKTSAGPIATCW